MNATDLFKKLEGVQTIESVMAPLDVDKEKAVYYLHRLRKQGYVKTRRRSDQTRIYNISFENKLKGTSYYEIINLHSPVKIAAPNVYNVYGKQPTIEETLIFAIKTKSVRTILASLGLFRKIEDWQELYRLSKENRIERQVGALYDLSRLIMKKIKRMPDKFRHYALPKEYYPFEYTVPGLQSKDFQDIERIWKVYIPFNKDDMEAYRDFR